MLLRVDNFEIDTDAFELRRSGDVIPTEPLVFDLICYMAENAGRLLSRDDLIDSVWDGRIVSDATISSCVKAARQALGDSGSQQKYIRTVRGRGFQFVKDVQPETPVTTDRDTQTAAPETKIPHSSLVILPFEAFGGVESTQVLCDALVENLTTILVRVPLLSLASRSSSFAYKGTSPTAALVRKDLHVSYMLEGSIQPLAGTLRTNVQLIETAGGFHLWAQQFDIADSSDALEDLLRQILPRLEAQLVRAMFNDLKGHDGELSARQLLLRATGLLATKGWHRDTFEEATELLRASIAKEPSIALSHAHLAITLGLGHRVGLLDKSGAIAAEAQQEAERALELDNMDSISVALAGCALADIGQPERAIPLLKRAIDLNPNNGHAWAALGSAQLLQKDVSSAIDNLTHGVKISPMDARLSVWISILALAYLQIGDVNAAKEAVKDACQADERNYMPRVVMGTINLVDEDTNAAQRAMQDALRANQDLGLTEVASLAGPKIGTALWDLRPQSG